MLASPVQGQVPTGWQLKWSDEFDGPGIDRAKWELADDCWGGGNEERQCYTDSARNASVEGGRLIITARREKIRGPALPIDQRAPADDPNSVATRYFSSAKLTTRNSAAWRYGKIEVRAKLPQGQGTWPAIWMLPAQNDYGSWAASGEIDILEAVNLGVQCKDCEEGGENTILGTLHFGGASPDNAFASTEIAFPEVLEGFHTYGIEWREGLVRWTVDGRIFAEKRASDWSTTGSVDPAAPFDRPFYLILNLAIGGRLPEGRAQGGVSNKDFPKSLEIEWVRVWQCAPPRDSDGSCVTGGGE